MSKSPNPQEVPENSYLAAKYLSPYLRQKYLKTGDNTKKKNDHHLE